MKACKKRNGKEACEEEDKTLRKKSGVFQDVRVHLKRVCLSELPEDNGKMSLLKLQQTLPLEPVLAKRRKATRATGIISKERKKEAHSNQRCSIAETMKKREKFTLCSQGESLKNTTCAARPFFGKSAEQTLCIQDDPDEFSHSKTLLSGE